MADVQVPAPRKARFQGKELPLLLLVPLLVALLVSTVVIVTIFNKPAPSCPHSCDDSDPCTSDSCNSQTARCVHGALNGQQTGCSGDSSVCKTKTCKDGSCVEELKSGCCGNSYCEGSETYASCSVDCERPLMELNCSNGRDDDLDNLADCADPDCDCPEDCSDGEDNDIDNLIDCCDPDCDCNETLCSDSLDNDCDNKTDCCDPDCKCKESKCDDKKDNDCDGKVDCADSDCATNSACEKDCTDIIMINEFRGEFSSALMSSEEHKCEDIPRGEWVSKISELACYTHENAYFDCDDLENETIYAQFKDFCEQNLEARWVCQSNYWGCLCHKSAPEEPEVEDTESNCGDEVDNDGDGLIDCMDPECCPPHYDQDSGDQCCCEDFFDSDDWGSCWPDCEDALCYGDEICQEFTYTWGLGCKCIEEEVPENYCEDVNYVNVDGTCPDYPCHTSGKRCRPKDIAEYGQLNLMYTPIEPVLVCDCTSDWGTEVGHCLDNVDNDNDGLIDCWDYEDCMCA